MVDFPVHRHTALNYFMLHFTCASYDLFRYGRKIVTILALVVQAFFTFISIFSPSWAVFCGLYFFVGVGNSSGFVAAFVLGTFVPLIPSKMYRVAHLFPMIMTQLFDFVLDPKERRYFALMFVKFSPLWVQILCLLWATCCCRCWPSSPETGRCFS